MLVRETAAALRGMRLDPTGLVVACRRIVERHPTSGALWWLCARVLTASDPFAEARRVCDEIDDDPTPQQVYELLADDATVCVIGWPSLSGEAIARRGDVRVLALDVEGEGRGFVRRLQHDGIEAEVVPPAGVAAAVISSDLVLLEAHACGPDAALVPIGSHGAAAVACCAGVAVWLVCGRGRRLPGGLWDAMRERAGGVGEPWEQAVESIDLQLVGQVISPDGMAAVTGEVQPDCAVAPELLRISPM